MKLTKIIGTAVAGMLAVVLAGCTDAEVAGQNLDIDSDNFKVLRRIVFVNGITDKYLFSVEGYCSITDETGSEGGANQLEVLCKTGKDQYKNHLLGLSDNVTYFVEQVDAANVSANHYKVVWKPSTIAPEIEVR